MGIMLSLRQNVLCRSHRLTVLNHSMVLLSLTSLILHSLLFMIFLISLTGILKYYLFIFYIIFFFQLFHHHLSPFPPPPAALHPAAIYALHLGALIPLKIHSDLPPNFFKNVSFISLFGDLFLSQGPSCNCSFFPHT